MKSKIYQLLLLIILSTTILFSLFLVCADNAAPFTTQASLQKNISFVSPEVSGTVMEVLVKNGEQIHKGQALFILDKTEFDFKVDETEALLEQAIEGHDANVADLIAAKQELTNAQVQLKVASENYQRYTQLIKKQLISQKSVDDAWANLQTKKSFVSQMEAKLAALTIRVGSITGTNAAIDLSQAQLNKANWSRSKTVVLADFEGIVTNLTLEKGTYVRAGEKILSLVGDKDSWLNADFPEKGLSHLNVGNSVLVSFDAFPGHVFKGKIKSQEKAIQSHYNSSGSLSKVGNDSRWIREQQKLRTRIEIESLPAELFSGSRASVIATNGGPVVDGLSQVWIHIVSMFRYIY
jgi:multidrug resistance efflux pump